MNFKHIITLFLIMATAMFTACSSSDDNNDHEALLPGQWFLKSSQHIASSNNQYSSNSEQTYSQDDLNGDCQRLDIERAANGSFNFTYYTFSTRRQEWVATSEKYNFVLRGDTLDSQGLLTHTYLIENLSSRRLVIKTQMPQEGQQYDVVRQSYEPLRK